MTTSNIVLHYQVRRRDLGGPLNLSAGEPQVVYEFAPDPRERRRFVDIYCKETEIQNVPTLSIASTNTDRVETAGKGMWHREGGWPPSVDRDEVEEQMKFCRRVERDEDYLKAAGRLVKVMNRHLRVNCAIDIFETFFDGERDAAVTTASSGPTRDGAAAGGADQDGSSRIGDSADPSSESAQAATLRSVAAAYSDEAVAAELFCAAKFPLPAALFASQRVAMHASWACGSESTRIAVAYADTTRSFASPSLAEPQCCVCVWDVSNPSHPASVLSSRDGDGSAVACSPKDPHVVVGGSSCGGLSMWDLRVGRVPVAQSVAGAAHRDAVTDIKFLLSKQSECFSVGLDGRVLFWDARKLGEPHENETVVLHQPALTASFSASAASGPLTPSAIVRCGATCLDYDPLVGGAHKYLVGTVDGRVISCNRRGKSTTIDACYGTVFDVMRCPANPKMFFAAGDWGFGMFGDELRDPFLTSGRLLAHVTAARWHPRRPSVIFTGTTAGDVQVWDLCQSHARSVMRVKVGEAPIRRIAPHIAGKHIAVLDAHGDFSLVVLPAVLQEAFPGEKVILNAMLEREYGRERAAKGKERRVAAAAVQAAAASGGAAPASPLLDAGPSLAVHMPHLLRPNDDVLEAQLAALGAQYIRDARGAPGEAADVRQAAHTAASAAPSERVASPEIETVDEMPDDDDDDDVNSAARAATSSAAAAPPPQPLSPAPPVGARSADAGKNPAHRVRAAPPSSQ